MYGRSTPPDSHRFEVVSKRIGRVISFQHGEIVVSAGRAVAQAVGKALRKLGRDRQVLCVTHLPQVAAQGDAQWTVAKKGGRGKVGSTATRLDRDEGEPTKALEARRTGEAERSNLGTHPELLIQLVSW